MPVAVNCCVPPATIVGFAGVTVIEVSVGGAWTVKVVLPVTPDSAAEIVAVPADTAVAKPLALIVATAVADELQDGWLVTFCVLPSE